jgi:hypothetical protein
MSRFEYKASQVNPVSPGQKVAHSGSLDDKNSQSKKKLRSGNPSKVSTQMLCDLFCVTSLLKTPVKEGA